MLSLPFRQEMFSILCGIFLLVIVVELIRSRKLLEQYSVIWFLIGLLCLTYYWWYPLAVHFTRYIGAGNTPSTILFFGLLVSLLIIMQLCIKITEFTHQIKDLVQEISILKFELKQSINAQKKDQIETESETKSEQN